MVSSPDVTVVGAGAVGLSTALYLARGGARVEVIDAGGVGGGASRYNAGWVVPSLSEPVPSPAALRTAAKWIGRKDGPLKLGFDPSPGYLSFLTRMLSASRPSAYRHGLEATAALATDAIAAFDDLSRTGVQFERHRRGVLLLFLNDDTIGAHLDDLAMMERLGLPGARPLSSAEVRELEPAAGHNVSGGIFCPEDQHVDPSTLVEGLATACRQAGVALRLHAPVTSLRAEAGHIQVGTESDVTTSGAVVLAGGVGTRRLAAMLGPRINVRAGIGYGFDYGPTPVQVKHAVYLGDHKVAVTPLERATRLAGTMEFGRDTGAIDRRRAAGIVTAMRTYFPEWPGDARQPWLGRRPMTPDGLPVIGRLSTTAPAYVASGHAMLGITLAPLTGQLLSQQILTDDDQPQLAPFAPGRFETKQRRAR